MPTSLYKETKNGMGGIQEKYFKQSYILDSEKFFPQSIEQLPLGLNLNNLSEEAMFNVEEDYQVYVRAMARSMNAKTYNKSTKI